MIRVLLVAGGLLFCLPATAQKTIGNCRQNPPLCEIEVGGQTLTFGMAKEHVLELFSKNIVENSDWSKEHAPDSLWYITDSSNAIKGGLKFRNNKLDGVMVMWAPSSEEQSDFAASLINLLQKLSDEGSTQCTLTTTRTPHPQQEEFAATFQCGIRSVSISHTTFQLLFKGQKIPDSAEIYEMLGNW